MTKKEKKYSFLELIKKGLNNLSKKVSFSISSPLAEKSGIITKNIDNKILQLEKRLMRKIYSSLIIGLGEVFLIFALFFFIAEHFNWNNSLTFFIIGTTIFVIGLLLKLKNYNE